VNFFADMNRLLTKAMQIAEAGKLSDAQALPEPELKLRRMAKELDKLPQL
jgi:hypothetical protein